MNETMAPMPDHVQKILLEYADLIQVVQCAVPRSITPHMALILAFVGTELISPSELLRRGYYIGTNCTYALKTLERLGLITDRPAKDKRCKLIELTSEGLEIAIQTRKVLEKTTSK
jgi:DNA-binding MarR family transcriptional regulator